MSCYWEAGHTTPRARALPRRAFIPAKPNECGRAQVGIWCPLGKTDLRDKLGFEPDAIFHLFPRKLPLCASLFFR